MVRKLRPLAGSCVKHRSKVKGVSPSWVRGQSGNSANSPSSDSHSVPDPSSPSCCSSMAGEMMYLLLGTDSSGVRRRR